MTRTVLVVGEPDDLHVGEVARLLRARHARVLLLDVVDQPGDGLRWILDSSRSTGACPTGALRVAGHWHDGTSIDAVWWRLKLVAGTAVLTSGGSAADFAIREWSAALDALPTVTPNARWTNPRTAAATARLKQCQLIAAAAAGLRVPRTLVANDPAELVAFANRQPAVYKVLTWYHAAPGRWTYTTDVDAATVTAHSDGVRAAPCLVQERISKDHELRVVVVGERVLAVRIDPMDPLPAVDWRRHPDALRYREVHLGPAIEAALLAINTRLGLHFGAHDLAVTPDGEPVFLEVNPTGQWLWLERASGAPITAAVADHLLAP